MIAPKIVVFRTDPHRSVVEELANSVAQNGPSEPPLTSSAVLPSALPTAIHLPAWCAPLMRRKIEK